MTYIVNLKQKPKIFPSGKKKGKKETIVKKELESIPRKALSTEPTESPALQSLEWTVLEFTKYQKDPLWFLLGGLIALIFLTIALFTKNFIFALIILLATFSIFIWAQKEPRKIKFAIIPKGIQIEDSIYNFENLKSFWIFYDPPEIKYLSLESKKLFMPKIIIPIGDANPNKIREMLLKYLPEEEQEESMIDILGRYLRY